MRNCWIIFLFVFTGLFHRETFAQIQGTTTVTISVPTVLDLAFASGQNPSANFNSTTLLDNGISTANATTLTYSSNQAWYITIAASSANFSSSSPTPMPASVIQYRLNGNTSYSALSVTPAALDGSAGSKIARGTATIGVDLKLQPGYIYAPGTYTMSIVYTISNL